MADYYGTIAGADAYNAARGNTAWAELTEAQKIAALIAGSAYVDMMAGLPIPSRPGCRWSYRGTRSGGINQVLMWPRDGSTDVDGTPIPDGAVPEAIIQAAYAAAAYAGADPSVLQPPVTGSSLVSMEKVDVLQVQYAVKASDGSIDPLANVPILPGVLAILGSLLIARCPRYGLGIRAA